ncbi:hypothetical protein EAI_07083 [Harpegnathos saltator]|uniref:Uncharacterized protein n=1 Tax=Harpegnathos saltator TaxID=610380 RepID=E2C1T8_HARSA|nr:hypothetical protein EAI_07083 [Harpegnathos saltator]
MWDSHPLKLISEAMCAKDEELVPHSLPSIAACGLRADTEASRAARESMKGGEPGEEGKAFSTSQGKSMAQSPFPCNSWSPMPSRRLRKGKYYLASQEGRAELSPVVRGFLNHRSGEGYASLRLLTMQAECKVHSAITGRSCLAGYEGGEGL